MLKIYFKNYTQNMLKIYTKYTQKYTQNILKKYT